MKKDPSIEIVPTDQLTPYPGNARTHSQAQIRQVAKSINQFGFINPIIIDANKGVVAGHARLMAAEMLGLKSVPCLRIDHLNAAEKRAYILADNKLAENASWDPGLLKVELEFLTQVDIDFEIDITGFSTPEIDIIMTDPVDDTLEPLPPPLPESSAAITTSGDLWKLGPHRILCGDCRELSVVEAVMAGNKARMVFTDPPYNVPIDGHARGNGRQQHGNFIMACGEMSPAQFTAFLKQTLGHFATVSHDGALHYVCMDWRHIGELRAAGAAVYTNLLNLCVWNKSNAGMGSFYRSKHELIFVFKNGSAPHINNVELGRHGRYRSNVWDYPGVNAFGSDREQNLAIHPTVKPVRMIKDAILDTSKRGDIVLDGFAGSGSTLLAAESSGRIFHGIEIDPRYVDVILQRWIKATDEQPIHATSGHSYATLVTSKQNGSAKLGVTG